MLSAAMPPGAGGQGGVAKGAPWPELREELQIHAVGCNRDGSPAWHICDPVRNLFFRIGWLEFEILRRWALGSEALIAQDVEVSTTLAAQAEDVGQLARFLAQHQLLRRATRAPAMALWRWLLNNYLFIRIPLVRPAHWLARLMPWVEWMFSRWFAVATVCAAGVGIVLASRQLDLVESGLRDAMGWDGVAGFAAALVFSKLLHELGHAVVSTRHGVRVGHMGIALLLMWPMPYTDTGESWKLARARSRLAIAGAGIASELVLAAWCTFLWAFMPDGNFRHVLFFLATTAWVLTLLVNASPFMRFDGYYMLADAFDFPGLHERAGRQARRLLRFWLPGLHEAPSELLTPAFRAFLVFFAFATWLYRLVLFLGIALVVYHAFFKALGVLLFVVEIAVFLGRPIFSELKLWWARRAEIPVRRLRTGAVLALFAAALLLLPWYSGVSAPGVVKAAVEQPVYTPYAARLELMAMRNDVAVARAGVLVTLDAPSQGEEREKAVALSAAYARAARGALGLADDGAARLAVAEQLSSRYEVERRAREAELLRLRVVATRDGVARDVDPDLRSGSWLAPSQLMAMVVDGAHWRAEALVSERDRLRISTGTRATVIVRGKTRKLTGAVIAIDSSPVTRLPHLLLAADHGGPIALSPTHAKKELRPAEAWFRVLVEGEGDAPVDAVHEARVHFDGTRESLARGWMESALSVLVQQSGF